MSAIIGKNTAADLQIQFENMSDIPVGKRFDIINTVNRSLNDATWETDTNFINRKYLHNPQFYQVFQVAKLFDEAVGYVLIRPARQAGTAYLSYVVVHDEHQKKGIGTALLNSATQIIQELGSEKMILDCEEENCSFYEKFAEKHSFVHSKTCIGKFAFGADKMQVTIQFSYT